MKSDEYDEVVSELQQRQNNLRCSELGALLKRLHFVVKEGSSKHHKMVKHAKLPGFFGSDYSCGHGKNPEVKPAYVRKLLRVITEYETELREIARGG